MHFSCEFTQRQHFEGLETKKAQMIENYSIIIKNMILYCVNIP